MVYVLTRDDGFWNKEDLEFFQLDESLYTQLKDRKQKLIEESFKNYMGSLYGKEPLPTLEELEKKLDFKIKQKSKLMANGHFDESLVTYYDELISEIYFQIRNKKYAPGTDSLQKKHRAAYEKKVNEWRNSLEFKSLETEINNYNMSKWQEIQEQANQTTHS